jgi:hypothetical protein
MAAAIASGKGIVAAGQGSSSPCLDPGARTPPSVEVVGDRRG